MRKNTYIPRHLRDKVDREIESGERVAWIDMPIPRFFTLASTGAFIFGIPWTTGVVFMTYVSLFGNLKPSYNVPEFMEGFDRLPILLILLLFLLVGLYMLSSPLWAYMGALRTVYVITNRRAITIDGGWSTTIRSYPPEKLQEIYRKEKHDGSGDVIISRREWRDSEGGSRSEELGFLQIRNPKEIEQMLEALAEQGASAVADKPRRPVTSNFMLQDSESLGTKNLEILFTKHGLVLGLVILLFMINFVIGYWWNYANDTEIFRSGKVAQAHVVDKLAQRTDDSTNYILRYWFEVPSRRIDASYYVSQALWDSVEEGQLLEIRYSEDNPTRNFPSGEGNTSLTETILMSAFAFVVAALGVYVILKYVRRKSSSNPPRI